MRDIEFRVWNIYSNEYEYTDLYWFEENMIRDSESFEINNHFIIEQYTGIKDKNGTKIFEGDIVSCNGTSGSSVCFGNIGYDGSFNGMTGFYLEEYTIEYPNITFMELDYYFNINEYEVIGNIHIKGSVK